MNKSGIDAAGIYATSRANSCSHEQRRVHLQRGASTHSDSTSTMSRRLDDPARRSRRAERSRHKTLLYGPVTNTTRSNTVPGNGQLNFVGFIDKRDELHVGHRRVPRHRPKGFGFDDLTVGTVLQVPATQRTVAQPASRSSPAGGCSRRRSARDARRARATQPRAGHLGHDGRAQQYPAATAEPLPELQRRWSHRLRQARQHGGAVRARPRPVVVLVRRRLRPVAARQRR